MMRNMMGIVAILFGMAFGVVAQEAKPLDFEGAKWVWLKPKPDSNLNTLPEGNCFFRAGVAVTERERIVTADLAVTADNLYEVIINGKLVGGRVANPDDWRLPKRFDVSSLLSLGDNTIAVQAVNTAPSPAGLLLKLHVVLTDGSIVELVSDASWKASIEAEPNWDQRDFNDQDWKPPHEITPHGGAPWGKLAVPGKAEPPTKEKESPVEAAVPEGFVWPSGIAFLGDDRSFTLAQSRKGGAWHTLGNMIFNPGFTRAFPEHDFPGPMKVGQTLRVIKPAKGGAEPKVLLDAGEGGAIGSPSVSFDGKWIYFSMVRPHSQEVPSAAPKSARDPAFDFAFYHIFRIAAAGGAPEQLTFGPFHDIDPVELPDGRVAFTSTRCGYFEEYHNTPSRALFTMSPDGSGIRTLTPTFIFDNEPEVMADGRILMIRSDNFFDRGKVETLLHAVHPDGGHGYTEFGLDLGPGYGNRLRAFNCGSPAPMPDGRIAYLTGASIAVGRPGCAQRDILNIPVPAGDVAALPDGRLLCTVRTSGGAFARVGEAKTPTPPGSFDLLGIVDPAFPQAKIVPVHAATDGATVHSPVFLGARERPPLLASPINDTAATGVLFCQDARLTRNTTAGWNHIVAVRVLMGKGVTTRSSHSYIVHAGNETIDLGTVPIAPDGSFAVEVPADAAIAFQMVDAEGRAELNEMSWIYVRPGESRGCVGCHAVRQTSPATVVTPRAIQATTAAPLRLTPGGDPHRFRGNNAAVTGMTELQFDRFREIASLNRTFVTSAELIKRLQGGTPEQRATAAHRLALTRDPAAAPALAQALKDPSRETRVAAALALAACGTRASADPLRKAAADPDLLVRLSADIALGNLLAGAADPDRAEAALTPQLADPDRDTVRRAARALRHIGTTDDTRKALRDTLLRMRDDDAFTKYRFQWDNAKFAADSPVNPRTVQEVTRALGHLRDTNAVPLLAETLAANSDPDKGNLFLAEACADALGLIATPDAQAALITTFLSLREYKRFTFWYGDHDALIACHASPVHLRIIEALENMATDGHPEIVPQLIHSVPTDFDRALFAPTDDAENLIGRLIRRQGAEALVTETCLAALGDTAATPDPDITAMLKKVYGSWGGNPPLDNRAAQILSLVTRDRQYAPRIQAAYARHLTVTDDIPRVFPSGIPVVQKLPTRNWVCFFLARALGEIGDPRSADALLAALAMPNEFANGSPDPLGPGQAFLHNELTPCHRAAAAWALGRLGDKKAIPALLAIVADFGNALDTRHAAATALGHLADRATLPALDKLAAAYPETSTRLALQASAAQTRGKSTPRPQ
ncbi:MAG: HEAT repeat domain-containing protein [Kiritimatiellaeota bacterium]|nr:HEAT repeat domain-containing protein [Kiritimatiellota bacterium]